MAQVRFDEVDQKIFKERAAEFNARHGLQVGHVVRFADGKMTRVSYIHEKEPKVQTSKGGSFYLEGEYMDFSGTSAGPIALCHFHRTNEKAAVPCWIFHHGYVTPGGRVDGTIEVSVWECDISHPEF